MTSYYVSTIQRRNCIFSGILQPPCIQSKATRLWTWLICSVVVFRHVPCISRFKYTPSTKLNSVANIQRWVQREGHVMSLDPPPMSCSNSSIHSHRLTQPWTQGLYGMDKCRTIVGSCQQVVRVNSPVHSNSKTKSCWLQSAAYSKNKQRPSVVPALTVLTTIHLHYAIWISNRHTCRYTQVHMATYM